MIDEILARGRRPIVAGGTGLYLRAALGELDFPPPIAESTRQDVERLVQDDLAGAVAELHRLRPDEAERIDLRNPRRVARSLELARAGADRPRTDRLWTATTRRPTTLIGVIRPRPALDRLIGARVRRELDDGLVDELARALDTPGLSRTAGQIIGMREVAELRAGAIPARDLPELLAARTRRLARAQLTWLRKTPGALTLDLGEEPPPSGLERLLELVRLGRSANDSSTLPA